MGFIPSVRGLHVGIPEKDAPMQPYLLLNYMYLQKGTKKLRIKRSAVRRDCPQRSRCTSTVPSSGTVYNPGLRSQRILTLLAYTSPFSLTSPLPGIRPAPALPLTVVPQIQMNPTVAAEFNSDLRRGSLCDCCRLLHVGQFVGEMCWEPCEGARSTPLSPSAAVTLAATPRDDLAPSNVTQTERCLCKKNEFILHFFAR